jgi:hypothetical protein
MLGAWALLPTPVGAGRLLYSRSLFFLKLVSFPPQIGLFCLYRAWALLPTQWALAGLW